MQIDPIIAPLLHSSKLPVYLDELNAFYAAEKVKRDQFHEWLKPDVKAEFIHGKVVVHSPARNKHLDVTKRLLTLLSTYVDLYELGSVKSEKALIKLTRNSFEPDICFFDNEKAASFKDDTLFFPAPDFVVEVLSDSTEKADRGIKMEDYALHGVKEYWIVDTEKEIIEQYLSDRGRFVLQPHYTEPLSSMVIKEFDIVTSAIFNNKENLAALQAILVVANKKRNKK